MRLFYLFHDVPDIIIDMTGTWLRVGVSMMGGHAYERIEIVRGKDYRLPGNITPAPGFVGREHSESSDRGNGRFHSEPKNSYGVRDHRPMTDAQREQARLYMMSAPDIDPDTLKNLFGKPMA